MGVIELASAKSLWRGFYYYEEGRAFDIDKSMLGFIRGKVNGSNDMVYKVEVNLEKLRSSTCTCSFKADKPKALCKHIVALYFSAYPSEAERLLKLNEQWEKEAQEEEQRRIKEIEAYVKKLSKADLQEMVIDQLVNEELYGRNRWQNYTD